jgi:hypothetical protein
MTERFYRRIQIGYRIFWVALLAALTAFELAPFWADLRSLARVLPHPYASTDAYLEGTIGTANGSYRWLDMLRRIPPTGAIVFFCPKGNVRADLIYGTINYLGWPRALEKQEIDPPGPGVKPPTFNRAATAAVIFCMVKPPPGAPPSWELGADVVVIPIAAPP